MKNKTEIKFAGWIWQMRQLRKTESDSLIKFIKSVQSLLEDLEDSDSHRNYVASPNPYFSTFPIKTYVDISEFVYLDEFMPESLEY